MKYTLTVNQKAILESGIDIDIIDSHILVSCMTFSHKRVCSKIESNGKIYYWFSHDMIVSELPLLKLQKDSVYRRMKKMCELGLLSQHPDSSRLRKSYYAIEELATNFEYEPSDETPTIIGPNTVDSSDKKPNNHNTIYPNTNTNNISSPVSNETEKTDIKIIDYIETETSTVEEKIIKRYHRFFCNLRTEPGKKCTHKTLNSQKMSSWKKDLDKIMRIDKRSKEDLYEVYLFLKDGKDDFWRNTIFSLSALREHYDQIMDKKRLEEKNATKAIANTKKEENTTVFKGDINRITKK
jgi:hypothetical protein